MCSLEIKAARQVLYSVSDSLATRKRVMQGQRSEFYIIHNYEFRITFAV